ncbi:hypothetical protein Tco_0109419 [Tanacetum coccineum]
MLREALAIDIYKRFSILEEERPVIETMAYSDKYKKILDGIVMDKIKTYGSSEGVLCPRRASVSHIIAKFLILYMPIDKDAPILVGAAKISLNTKESDSDDDKDYGIQRNSFGAPIRFFFIASQKGPQLLVVEEALMGHIGKRAFDINEPIYTELCHEFYATFEFDEVVADDELMKKKAIKFRLCGKAYAMSILDFAKRLGLYIGAKVQEYGFETYFIGGLRNDDDFSADQYWLNISSEETLTLSRSSAKTIRKPVLRDGYANVTWLIGNVFVTRIVIRLGMLTRWELNGLSAQTYCRTLDANILRKLIGSNRRLIPEEIAPSIPRVATPRAHALKFDLYDKISQLETQIGEIGRMTRMQSYHSDRYARVLEHIASHYGFTLRDPYNPLNYFEQQQQHDDQE